MAKKPKPAKAPDPALAVGCPACMVLPGSKCKNYKGQNKFTCKERKTGKPAAPPQPAKPPPATPSLFDE